MTDIKLFLTIATTGLRDCANPGFRPEIIQFTLASSEGSDLLTRCIVPTGAIQQQASEFNGYTIIKRENGSRKLMRNGEEVKTVTLKQAIHDLLGEIEARLEQVSPGGRIILMGYNSEKYDIPVLEDEIRACGLSTERLDSKVICADLYRLIDSNRCQILPGHQGNLKMTTVYNLLCGMREPHRHNAVEDARKLVAIYDKISQFDLQPFTSPLEVKSDTDDCMGDRDRTLKTWPDASDVDRESKPAKRRRLG